MKIEVTTHDEWLQAQYAANQIEAAASDLPGWMREECGIDDVIEALWETDDPEEEGL